VLIPFHLLQSTGSRFAHFHLGIDVTSIIVVHPRAACFLYFGWYIRDALPHPDVPRIAGPPTELMELIESIANDPASPVDTDFEPGDIRFLKNSTILHCCIRVVASRVRDGFKPPITEVLARRQNFRFHRVSATP
jgi:hypothetical protein